MKSVVGNMIAPQLYVRFASVYAVYYTLRARLWSLAGHIGQRTCAYKKERQMIISPTATMPALFSTAWRHLTGDNDGGDDVALRSRVLCT